MENDPPRKIPTPLYRKATPLNRKNDPRGSQRFKIRVLTHKKYTTHPGGVFFMNVRWTRTHSNAQNLPLPP